MIIVAIIALGLAVFVSIGNIIGCCAAIRRRRKGGTRGYSCVPLVSIVFCTIAWLNTPESIGAWAFLPAALDPGTYSLASLPFYLAWRWHNDQR
jgi:hypothetical protein